MTESTEGKRWWWRASFVVVALPALYVVGIGPVSRWGCGSATSIRSVNAVYEPLRRLAQLPLPHRALSAYVELWTDDIVFDWEWGLMSEPAWILRDGHIDRRRRR